MRAVGSVEEQAAQLRPACDLWESPFFQDWVKGTREELQALKELPWALGHRGLASNHDKILESCGLALPKDRQEFYECFIAMKTVVHFVERKLKVLEHQAARYYELLEKEKRRREDER